MMKSLVVKRSVVIGGHKTSVSLEDAFWSDLKDIANTQHATLSEVVTKIDKGRRVRPSPYAWKLVAIFSLPAI